MVMHSVVSYYHIMGSRVGVKPIHKVMVHMIALKNQVSDTNRIKSKTIVVYLIILNYACASVAIVAYARTATATFVSQVCDFRISNICGACCFIFYYYVWPWYRIYAGVFVFSVWQHIKLKFSIILGHRVPGCYFYRVNL